MTLEEKIEIILTETRRAYDEDDPTAWGWGIREILEAVSQWGDDAVGEDEDEKEPKGEKYQDDRILKGDRNELRSEIKSTMQKTLRRKDE